MKHLFLAAAALVVLPVGGTAFAQTTTAPTTAPTTTAPTMPDQTTPAPTDQTDTMAPATPPSDAMMPPATPPSDAMMPPATTGTVTATPPAGSAGTVTATPPAPTDGTMTTQTAPAMPTTTGGDPVGGYQPSGQALSAPLAPGQTATFQPAQSPDQAFPAPAPLTTYPVCKAGQFDKCIQRGEGRSPRRGRR